MKQISITEAKKNLCEIVELLQKNKEDGFVVTKYGKPVVQISPISKTSKRVGIAKEEMKGFDISLEEFNSITTF